MPNTQLLCVRRPCGCKAALWPSSEPDGLRKARMEANTLMGEVVEIDGKDADRAIQEVRAGCTHRMGWDARCGLEPVTTKDTKLDMHRYLSEAPMPKAVAEKLGLDEGRTPVPALFVNEVNTAVLKSFDVRVNQEGAPALPEWHVRGSGQWCEMRLNYEDQGITKGGRRVYGALGGLLVLGLAAITRSARNVPDGTGDEVWCRGTVNGIGGKAPEYLPEVSKTIALGMLAGLVTMHHMRIDLRLGAIAMWNAEAVLGKCARGARHWAHDIIAEEIAVRGRFDQLLGPDAGMAAWSRSSSSWERSLIVARGTAEVMRTLFDGSTKP